MHYQPDWLLEIGLHVYCSLLFLDSNSILAGGYSDCFLIKHLKWVDLNWKERNRSMTYQKLEWNRWSWNKNHFKKIHQKSCQNLMTTLLNPHLFFSQPGKYQKKNPPGFFLSKSRLPERTSTQVVVPVASRNPRMPPSQNRCWRRCHGKLGGFSRKLGSMVPWSWRFGRSVSFLFMGDL